jgi:hypothetical protein
MFDLGKEIHTMMRKLAVLILFHSLSQAFWGQSNPPAVTNSDLIKMADAGIGEQAMILAIQRGPTMLDTSPQALIALIKAGVSDHALSAALTANQSQSQLHAQPSQSAPTGSTDKSLGTPAHEASTQIRYRRPENPRTGFRWHLW